MPRPVKKVMGEDMVNNSSSSSPKNSLKRSAADNCCTPDGKCSMGGSCAGAACGCGMGMMHHRGTGGKFAKCMAGLLFLALTVVVVSQLLGNPWYKNIKAEFTAQPYARTITVDGEGKVTVQPDIARVDLGVVATGKTVKEVTQDSNAKMKTITDAMKKLGVKAEDLQTSSYDLSPTYPPYNPNNPAANIQQITGYTINQTLSVKIRDLAKTDDVLDQAVTAGANTVGQLTFDLDDASKVKSEARKMAFDKAKQKAAEMAGAAGVNVGKVVTFSESTSGGVMPYANFTMKAMSDASTVAPSVEAGSKEFTIDVSVTYEIE